MPNPNSKKKAPHHRQVSEGLPGDHISPASRRPGGAREDRTAAPIQGPAIHGAKLALARQAIAIIVKLAGESR
jgi:hypothetical protein